MPTRTAPPAFRKETPPSSSYDDTDDEDDKDVEDVAGRIMAEKPNTAVERLDDHNSDDDGSGEESDEVDSDSREDATPPRSKKKQGRLHQDAAENEEANNRAEWSSAVTYRTSTSGGCSTSYITIWREEDKL